MNETQSIVASPPSKTNGLSKRLVGGLVALIALICGVSFYVIWFQGRPLLDELSQNAQVKLGKNITLALGQELSKIEGITQSMSSLAVNIPKNPESFHNIYPSILNQLGLKSVIAGGGIWPEEGAFISDKSRYSFFWGRGKDGQLKFYNDYNVPEGSGYHNEEWYVPARLLPPNNVYWSRSYTDPYSLQPMVTCTAPMVNDGKFIGVATVDLKLDGVSKHLDSFVDDNSYAFVVDRNNKFISFPQPKLVLMERKEEGKLTPDFMYVSELAETQPMFLKMAEELNVLEYRQFMKIRESHSNHDQYVRYLSASSYQISSDEAKRISSHLWSLQYNPAVSPLELTRFTLKNDLVFQEPVSVVVFQMPITNWKVVTVFKQSASQAVTNSISYKLIYSILISVIIFGALAFFGLKNSILKRLKKMTEQLRLAVENDTPGGLELKYDDSDEIGALIYWYNRRSLQLETARRQAERANKDKTDFLAKMSHEFRTPLNSIIGFSRRLMLNLQDKLEPRYGSALNSIYRSALQQLDLVNDILDHSSIESGDVQLSLSYESVNDIVESIEAKMKDLAIAQNVDFRIESLADDKDIYCDKLKVRQLICNLISNAFKADSKGKVSLLVENSFMGLQEAVSFTIEDRGCGIAVEDQARLFRPFTQLDNRICVPGTGLGLFLTRYYVSLHAGDITLRSDPTVEPGSTFIVRLPLVGPEPK